MVSQIGWHDHLPAEKQLNIPQAGIDTLVRGLGTDSARYGDVALEALGLSKDIKDPVFISKLGFGMSDQRHQFEQVYTAYIQFKTADDQPHSLALSLRAAKKPDSKNAAMQLDAKMATQVTAILHKLIEGAL